MNFIVIPARANSKRLKNKNIKILNNKPLISHILDILEKNSFKEDVYVTTDSKKIIKILKKYKKINFVKRPKKLSTNASTVEDAILHLIRIKKLKHYNWVITIQPNSPFIKLNSIKKIISLTNKTNANCIMTVTKNYSDLWVSDKTKYIKRLFKNAPRRTQLREPVFEENSAIYATRISYLMKKKKIYDKKNIFLELSKIEGLDINDSSDFKLAESLLKNAK